ncbi:CrcB family protein [Hamadaea sp. NPDC050747]|uniref:fluoride efflux transporter FluC n=1 Tax=Hamadaea sp. NPDC050747 TaxID=3155789 RepID=UPI0033DA209F
MIKTVAVISLGGLLGALARFGLGVAFPVAPHTFPWTTFAINVVGCLLLGFIAPLTAGLVRPFVGTGVLGGFTTFSTYILEIHRLVRAEQLPTAVGYLGATAISALLAAYLGGVLADSVARGRVKA